MDFDKMIGKETILLLDPLKDNKGYGIGYNKQPISYWQPKNTQ